MGEIIKLPTPKSEGFKAWEDNILTPGSKIAYMYRVFWNARKEDCRVHRIEVLGHSYETLYDGGTCALIIRDRPTSIDANGIKTWDWPSYFPVEGQAMALAETFVQGPIIFGFENELPTEVFEAMRRRELIITWC